MNRFGALGAALAVLAAASAGSRDACAGDPPANDARVIVLDDGEKIARGFDHPLPPGPWPARDVDLFAMRGETIALQIVIEAGAIEAGGVHASIGALTSDEGVVLDARAALFAERFIDVLRPSGNDRTGESLAFTAAAAPNGYVGALADPLVPIALAGDLAIAPHTRGAIWVDVEVASEARPGLYRGAIVVRGDAGEIAVRRVALRVLDRELPYAAAKTMIYYDRRELEARGLDAGAEAELRRLFHENHVSAIHEIKDARDVEREVEEEAGEGEGVLAIGAYGALGAPSASSLAEAEAIVGALRDRGVVDRSDTFVYAVDEDCESNWGAKWLGLVKRSATLRGVRVGVTCGRDPMAQAADLVMQTPEDLVPARARIAKENGKWVWAYNGKRPFAGPMVLDTPAVDLRANAWIAARYGIDRWFYWESTFWLDANAGGRGAKTGDAAFDPFVVAETFHNEGGDYSNGDGILVYPGSQRARGMTDYGVRDVFPSVRLANIRRGVEDMGYLLLARAIDRRRADAIVRRMIPRALALAPEGARAAWPERGTAWIEARRALAGIALDAVPRAGGSDASGDVVLAGELASNVSNASSRAPAYEPTDVRHAARMSDGCNVKSFARSRARTSAAALAALVLISAIARRRSRSRRVLPA